MAKGIYQHLTSLFRLSVLIIATSRFSWCQEAVNSTLPCPVTNSTTGAMLCCSSLEANVTQPPDEDDECKEILPITSASQFEEFWTIKDFNLARQERQNMSSPQNISSPLQPRDGDRTCCCKEKRDFILPGMATTVSGSVTQVLQNSPGYVQPVSARLCKEASCSRRANGKKQISSCIQLWTATDLYIEDPFYDGFMRKESIKVPNGCNCRIPETDPSNDNKTVRAFHEKEKYVGKVTLEPEDTIVTNIPTLPDTGYSHETVSRDRSILNITNASSSSHQSQYSNTGYISLPVGNLTNVSRPQTSSGGTRVQYLTDETHKVILPSQNQHSQEKPISASSSNRSDIIYDRLFMGAPNASQKTPLENQQTHPGNFEGAPTRQGPIQNIGNDPQAAFGTLVPQDRLRALNNLASSPTLQPVNPQLVSNLNDLNSLMANYIKMGLLSANARAMTTTQIVENALTKVHSSQQMQALAMAERLMLLEIEYLRLSLNMAEMSLRQFDASASSGLPKFSFPNDHTRDIPLIFKPGGLSGPLPVAIVESNKTSSFSGSSPNIPSSQGSGAAKPLTFGNLPVRGDLAPFVPFKEDSVSLKVETSSPKTEVTPKKETPPSKSESSPSKLETPPPRKETPAGGENTKLRAELLPRNTSRSSMLDDMLEEDLYAAFANYLFQEAWMNSSCMVPLSINESQSELNFLPSVIKEKLDIRVGGRVDIHKFAARIISGIIMCRFQSPEAALLDGRLARAITGGIKVAQILNNHIKITKGLMRGILDTDEAKGLVNILSWASRPTGSPAREEFVSSRDAVDLDNLLSLVKDSLKVYIDIFGTSIKAAMDEMQGISFASSISQSAPTATEASSSMKNPLSPLRNIGIKPQDNGTIGLNATIVVMPGFNGTRPGMSSTATPLAGTKITLSATGTNNTAVASVTAGSVTGSAGATIVISGINTSANITSVTASSPVTTAKPVSNTTATAISGMSTTAAIAPVTNTTPPVLSSTTTQPKRNDTLLGGSGVVSQATPNPSQYDKYTPVKEVVIPDPHYHYNKSHDRGKPPLYTSHPDSSADITSVTKNTSRKDPDAWVAGLGDFDYKDKTDDKKGPADLTGDNFGFGPGPEDYEGSAEYSPVAGSVVYPKQLPKNPYVIANLPKEYDPLDIAPGSLMNLLFPNLR